MNRHSKHFTRGGQIAFHNLRMLYQINKALFFVHLLTWIFISLTLILVNISKDNLIQALFYEIAKLFDLFKYKHEFHMPCGIVTTAHDLLVSPYYKEVTQNCINHITKYLILSLKLTLTFATLISWYFFNKGKIQAENKLIRGSSFKKPCLLQKEIIKQNKASDIKIDGFPIIKGSEVQHILVHGTVGTGKSQLIMKILGAIKKRGDRAIIYDKGCSFIPHYYNKSQDVILNPFDIRTSNWDLWSEAPKDSDLENIAESLFPVENDSDPFWVNAARLVFKAVSSKMRKDANRSLKKLIAILLGSDLEEYLKDTEASQLINTKSEKTASSIRAVITTYLKSLELLSDLEGDKFSIRDYLLNDKTQGWIFISSNGEQHKSLKPLITMWLSMASLTILSLEPNSKRRIWLIADELPSLHKLPLLGETIAESRKFGGCFLLGMQNFAQLEKVYGRSGAQEIFDLLNTRFFFRSPSSDMAKIVSRELGEEDIDESKEQYSYGANNIRDGVANSFQRLTRPIVFYPEILELPNLTCFLRLPGKYSITKLILKYKNRPEITNNFIPRTILKTKVSATNIDKEECQNEIKLNKSYSIADFMD